ncbi:NAD(P)/FAD-dependent oxidoreductase [Nocardia altamirensis]|uniref:NAD(P)/FAD-dependent oxidoreductase n=1 Tax=Nocardia altamirensis TaxID=472158 RepID=UPI000A056557|nr:FAD-dependent oxidoreductase [Nocardia altamirensis]
MDQPTAPRSGGVRRIAVIGSGVAGLTAAWVLSGSAEVTLYEADNRLGGHADTHVVTASDGATIGVDTGFLVHNDRTYPTLLRLFRELGIATQDSDMSMSVRCDGCGLEYAGARGLGGLFASPRSLTRARYLRLLAEVPRFHRLASAELAHDTETGRTLGEFVFATGFTDYFVTHFLVPLVAAVWSCDPATALRYPARYLFTFLDHHGMLTVFDSPTWRTVTGGSATYVRAIADRLDTVLTGTPVRAVHRLADGVAVRDDSDEVMVFDGAVVATHPDQALRLLAEPTDAERAVLSALPYSVNHTVLHTDTSVLPRAERARASWNYRLPSCAAQPDRVLVSYDLSRLQRLDGDRRFLVTLGDGDRVDQDQVIDRMVYQHPRYTVTSLAAQRRLGEIGCARVRFAGAYHGWGFHEDGALAGLRAATRLGARWHTTPVAAVHTS